MPCIRICVPSAGGTGEGREGEGTPPCARFPVAEGLRGAVFII